jgi:hypothetical protein
MEVDSFQTEFSDHFNHINTLPTNSKQAAYQSLLEKILSESTGDNIVQNLNAYIAVLVGGDVTISGVQAGKEPLTITALRPLLDNFTAKLTSSSIK